MDVDDHIYCLGLGANIIPHQNLHNAIESLRRYVKVEKVSSIWRTPSFGAVGPDFLNAAALVRTHHPPDILKEEILCYIEEELGRVRSENKFAPRTIDIDILVFDDQIIDEQIWYQPHLALPIAELLPELTNPQNGETIEEAAIRLSKTVINITRFDDT